MTLFSFTIARSLLTALLVFSVLAGVLQLVVALAHRLYDVRQRMARARVVAAYTDPIIELLVGEGDEQGRRDFIASLPRDTTERAMVVDLLLSSALKVRGDARETVTRVLNDAGLADEYLRRLNRRSTRERALAAEALGEMRVVSAMDALVLRLHDRSPVVRVVAARALGKLGQPEVVAPLLAGFADGRLPSGIVASSLLHLGPQAGPALATRLCDERASIRALAAKLIGLLDWTPAADDMLALLEDVDRAVRVEAAVSLGRMGTDSATAPLLARLLDPDTEARMASAEALGRLGDPAATRGLVMALGDHEHEVRMAAATALAALGTSGLRTLARVARDEDTQTRAYAVEVLQRAGREDLLTTPAGEPVHAPATESAPLPVASPLRTDTRVLAAPSHAVSSSTHAPTDGALRASPAEDPAETLPVPPEIAAMPAALLALPDVVEPPSSSGYGLLN